MNYHDQIQVELQESMGTDRSIAEAAWTSSLHLSKKLAKTDDDVKHLVTRLAQDRHSVPFESVIFRFWLKLPIQTDRQLMTHRIASHSGMSGRYRTMPQEFLNVPPDVEEILNNIVCVDDTLTAPVIIDAKQEYYNLCESANKLYRSVLHAAKLAENASCITNEEYKRLREFYRGVLPQNNMTERVTIMNLRSFANFQKLRNSEHAQPEIRQIAQLMLNAVKNAQNCPIAISVLESLDWSI